MFVPGGASDGSRKVSEEGFSRTAAYRVEFAGAGGREIAVPASTQGIWRWYFRCGERAIKPGGALQLFCEVPKFWLAVCLQTESPEKPGYVCVQGTNGVSAVLEKVAPFYKNLAFATVRLPDGMQQGQELFVQFGTEDKPCYAIAHKYGYIPVTWRVDYEADGKLYGIWPPMVVRITPGDAAKLVIVAPSTVKPDEHFSVRGRVEDINSNIGARLKSGVRLELIDSQNRVVPGSRKQASVGDDGTFEIDGWRIDSPGIYRIDAAADGLPQVLSNPVTVDSSIGKVAWGDCHCHTMWADGVGTLAENLGYARDQAFLDVFAFTEHLGHHTFYTLAVDKGGADWALLGQDVARCVRESYEPGKFVTILGYENSPQIPTKDPNGDFCVFSPSDRWEDMPAAFEYTDLTGLARKQGCLAIPHVGGRYARWEELPVDPDVTPLVEIASMHGHFECYAQQGLRLGHKLGFVGMSDGHFGMPGYDNWALHGRTPRLRHRNYSVQSAITGFCVPELTREAVMDAMRRRRTYATTGQRILLDFKVDDTPMGEELSTAANPCLHITVNGTAPIALVDIIRGDRRVHRIETDGMDVDVEWTDSNPCTGETWYYVRVTQEDFSLAWSSPVWVNHTGQNGAGESETKQLPSWDAAPYWPYDRPETCNPAHTSRLESILSERGDGGRFTDIHQVGVFSEPRGRFVLFRTVDRQRDDTSVYMHMYLDLPDDRITIADGWQNFGVSLY